MMGNNLELCIIAEDWEAKDFIKGGDSKKERHGLTTYDLRTRDPYSGEQMVAASMCAGGINVPEDHESPFVMVGLGTGIAPLRAMI